MPSTKAYEEMCPSHRCSCGTTQLTWVNDPDKIRLPSGLKSQKSQDEAIAMCHYCGIVWFQKRSNPLGLDPRIVGKYHIGPREFQPFAEAEVREKNTSQYWRGREHAKLRRQVRGTFGH
jgi:hypothetical protein